MTEPKIVTGFIDPTKIRAHGEAYSWYPNDIDWLRENYPKVMHEVLELRAKAEAQAAEIARRQAEIEALKRKHKKAPKAPQ